VSGTVRWQDVVATVEQRRRDAGVPTRTAAQRAAALRRLEDEVRAARLAGLRRDAGLDLATLAQRLDLHAERLGGVERGDLGRVDLEALRAYVEALGGELTVYAQFGDVSYRVA
jgi:hypothetical protein